MTEPSEKFIQATSLDYTAETETEESASYLSELNHAQLEAVTYGEGPLLIVAGAGSGKTKTLAYRVANLIHKGIDPSRILLLTFTRRASQEMLDRARTIVQDSASDANAVRNVWGGTFHAIANRLLRIYAPALGLSPDFTVMDQGDAEEMMNVVRHELGLHKKDKRFPRKNTCLNIYSRCIDGTEDLATVLKKFFPWCSQWEEEFKELFRYYVERKQEQQILDYGDLLLYWKHLMESDRMAELIGNRFEHILVDEYQDTNPVQAAILENMRKFNSNITAVGDDAQSIYRFRAATVQNMLNFPEKFPGTRVIKLEQNYRSTPEILHTANEVSKQAKELYDKQLWSTQHNGEKPRLVTCLDEAQQDEFVAKQILERYEEGTPLHKQAVLFRASHLSDSLEVVLTRKNIPYRKYGGLNFLETGHIKDLLAFFKIVENPRDSIAWYRVLQLFDKIGPARAQKIFQHICVNHGDPRSITSYTAATPAQQSIEDLGQLFEDLIQAGRNDPATQVARVRSFYEPFLDRNYSNASVRKRDIENLERIASGYRSRHRFLTQLVLDPPTSTSDLAEDASEEEDWVVLSTIHSAKGCEWDVVNLIHAADGWLPVDFAAGDKEALEEELRLTYVALTRACDQLYVTWPLRYYHRRNGLADNHTYARLSRFLDEKPRTTFVEIQVNQEAESDKTPGLNPADVQRHLREMW